jgi:hypothetical protein
MMDGTFPPTARAPVERPSRKEYWMDRGRSLHLAHSSPEVSLRNATVFWGLQKAKARWISEVACGGNRIWQRRQTR